MQAQTGRKTISKPTQFGAAVKGLVIACLSLGAFWARGEATPCAFQMLSHRPWEARSTDPELVRMREAARTGGVTVVLGSSFKTYFGNKKLPEAADRAKLEELFGAKVCFVEEEKEARKVPGLVLDFTDDREGSKLIVGDFNLLSSDITQPKFTDRWQEHLWAANVDPSAVAETRLASWIVRQTSGHAAFATDSRQLLGALDEFVRSPEPAASKVLRDKTLAVVNHFITSVNEFFPDGAFVNATVCPSGSCTQIHLADAGAEKFTDDFLLELAKAKASLKVPATFFSDSKITEALQRSGVGAAYLVRGLAVDTRQIMVQKKLNVAQTRDGHPVVVRVDFMRFGIGNATLKDGYDVSGSYVRKAVEFFTAFWDKIPRAQRAVWGGADLTVLTDGSIKITALNLGKTSRTMNAEQVAIAGNLFVSRVLGHPTTLVAKLEEAALGTFEDQMGLLNAAKIAVKNEADRHHGLDDLYIFDVFQYLRDRMIQNWLRNPREEAGMRLQLWIERLADEQSKRTNNAAAKKALAEIAKFGSDYIASTLKRGGTPVRIGQN